MSNIEKTPEYLEYYDNELGQVYAAFNTFLYLSYHDTNKNKMLHNLYREMERIYFRLLCGFFIEKRQFSDDLIYSDFISKSTEFEINLDDDVRVFINKSTAHLSKSRGRIDYPDEGVKKLRLLLTKTINQFLKRIDGGELKSNYQPLLQDKYVIKLKNSICNHIDNILILYKEKGVSIEI